MEEKEFKIWAIINQFGHTTLAGEISEQQIVGFGYIRVEIPKTSMHPEFTRFVNPSGCFDINPCTKEVAEAMAEKLHVKPISVFDVREVVKHMKALESNSPDFEEE